MNKRVLYGYLKRYMNYPVLG